MPVIELKGTRCFYISHVSDSNDNLKTAVLIHGAGGNHLSMLNIFNYMRLKYGKTLNIITMDLPGHFKSAKADWQQSDASLEGNPSEEFGITRYAETIHSLLLSLQTQLSEILLIGHSMGAQICIKYASMYLEDTEKCMLIAGCDNPETSLEFIASLENNFERTVRIFLSDALATKNKIAIEKAFSDISRTPPEIVASDFKSVRYFGMNCGEDLKKINSGKTFFNMVYSDADRIIKSKCVERFAEELKNSVLNKIPAENHMDFLYGNNRMEKELDKFLLT